MSRTIYNTILYVLRRIKKYMKDMYVRKFVVCRKCSKQIDPTDGYWFWKYCKEQKGGYYHTECGMINNPAPKEFLPF